MAKLERCHLDGSERRRIVDSGTEQPTALTLDLVKKLVYWADVYLDFIAVVDYDGKNKHTIARGNLVSKINWLFIIIINNNINIISSITFNYYYL